MADWNMKTEQLTVHDINMLPRLTFRRMGLNGEAFDEEMAAVGTFADRPLPPQSKQYTVSSRIAVPKDYDVPTALGENFRQYVTGAHNAGFSLETVPHVRIAEPIIIPYTVSDEHPALVDDTLVVAAEGSEVTLVQTIRSSGIPHEGRFYAGSTRVVAHAHSRVTLVQVQLLDDLAVGFNDCGVYAGENAQVQIVQVLIGGRKLFGGSQVLLAGDDAAYHVGSMYLGDGQRISDLSYMAVHKGRRTLSDIVGRGALLDEAFKVFRGTIDFVPGASGSKGAEEEFSLMFSPRVRNKSVPLILCGEEDVEGAHAVSTGRIDADALFYLMSRGLDEAMAKKLLVEAQFKPIVDLLPTEELREELARVIEKRLAR